MLVSGGQILALSKVKTDNTLKGLGTPDSPLGISHPEQFVQKEWVENTFVSAEYLKENYWTSGQVEERVQQIPGATNYSAGNGIKIEDYIISLQESAFNPYATKQWVGEQDYATKEFVTSADGIIKNWVENNYWASSATSAEIARQLADFGGFVPTSSLPPTGDPKKIYLIRETSAVGVDEYKEYIWNNNTWLCIGDTSMDLTPYAKTEDVNALFAETSSWAEETFQPKGNYVDVEDFESYQSEVEQEFSNTSAWAKNTFVSANEFEEYKTEVTEALGGKLNKSDFDTYSAGIDDDLRNINDALDDKMDKTASANWDLDEYSGKDGIKIENHWVSISSDFVTPEGLTNELKGYYTKDETSGAEALAEEFAKCQPSGDYITSAAADEKYIPKTWSANKDFTSYSGGEGIKVENHIISLSAVPQNIEIISHDESVNVSSATDPQTGITTYDLTVPPPADEVKISGDNGVSAQYNEATSAWVIGLEHIDPATYMGTQSTLTTLTADATSENPETLSGFGINTQIFGTDITVTTDTVTLEKGMYHVDIQINVSVPGGDPSYYTTTIKPTLSYSTLTHVIDGSYAHAETLDLSFIVNVAEATGSSALQFKLEGLPAGASYVIKNLQICEIVTINSELHSEGGTYTGGTAIAIDTQNKINVKYNTASGIGLDKNGQLMVKLGKGLAFDTSGAAEGTLMLDNVTTQVVETVTKLEKELDGKLTVNFNYPQITDNNYDFTNLKNGDTCICQLFSVPLQHEIIENKTIFSVYVKDTGYSQANVILGIFEYDFDGNNGTGTTNWVCDTGPVSLGKQTTNDKLEFPVTHINPDRHVLRSDRAYYAVLAMKSDGGTGIYLASCPGYSPNVNSNPTLNWRYDNAVGLDFVNTSGSLANTEWWNSGYNEKNDMNRFFLQIRNKVEV